MKTEKNIGLSIFSYCLYPASSELRVKTYMYSNDFHGNVRFQSNFKNIVTFSFTRLTCGRSNAPRFSEHNSSNIQMQSCEQTRMFSALSNLTAFWTVSRGVHLSGRLSFFPRNDNSLREYPNRSRKGAGKAGINVQVVFTRETVLKGPLDRKLKEGFCTIRPYTSNDHSTTSSVLLV